MTGRGGVGAARVALVTGATGCLGQALCAELAASGWIVRSLSRGTTPPQAPTRLHVALDLSDGALPPDLCAQVDAVFHCAALSSDWGTAEAFYRANVIATERIMAAARAAAVPRLVLASSASVYVGSRPRLELREDAPLPHRFVNDYARTKYLAERLVLAGNDAAMTTVALRLRAIYGPHDRALLPRLLRVLDSGLPVPLPGGGAALIDPTHARDAARAMRLAAEAPAERVGGRAYNITSGERVSAAALLDRLAGALGRPVPRLAVPLPAARLAASLAETGARLTGGSEPALTRHGVLALGQSLTLDISAARRDLGYRPQVSLAEGLADLTAAPADAAPGVRLAPVGHCLAPQTGLRRDRPPRPVAVPALVAAIAHPGRGVTLFDCGFGSARRGTGWPMARAAALPSWLPVAERLPATLDRLGAARPARIVLSHLHEDHVGGLADLPDPLPPIWASRAALDALATGPRGPADTLPPALVARLRALVRAGRLCALETLPAAELPAPLSCLGPGRDVLGDGSLLTVNLPGHGVGQVGAFLPRTPRGPVLLAADAAFSAAALAANAPPPYPVLAVLGMPAAYLATFAALARAQAGGVTIICAHDPQVLA